MMYGNEGVGLEWRHSPREKYYEYLENGVDQMAKGQVKKEKTNKAKLSPKEKKKQKAEKKAAKSRK